MTTHEKLWHSAERFGLANVDQNIAAWIRHYAEADIFDWIEAENALMRILLDLAIIAPDNLVPADGESDAVANTLARALGSCDRITEYSTDYLTTLSALAFAAVGNFPSASVLARRAYKNANAGPLEQWMTQILSDRQLDFSRTQAPHGFVSYVQFIEHALQDGWQEDFDKATNELQSACRTSFEALARTDKYLLLFWQQVHKRFEELSVARLLRKIRFPHQAYIQELIDSSSPLFYPSQVRTLLEQPLIEPRQPVFVTLPTSTGKSLLGEIALVSSLAWDRGHWLAVYLAPYRALTDQLQERMRARLESRRVNIRCIIRRGGYLTDMSAIEARLPTVLVATPEAFDALLRQRPELYKCLAACVFDEFHLIEQQGRGLRYEGLLGRLLCGAAGEGWPKIVALSAVVQETSRVIQWLRMGEENVARLPWRSTSRRLAITDPHGKIRYFSPADKQEAWSGHIDLPHHITRAPTSRYATAQDRYRRQVAENVAQVAMDQWQRLGQPILVLASSKSSTRTIAQIAAARLSPLKGSKANQLAYDIRSRYPYLYTLQECLMRGVAYHNASLPNWVRSQLEKIIGDKELKIVAATTTLAEGVDLPFRVVVLADWRLWLFGQRQPMPSLLFQNIAGRCGRAWEFVEGDTIIVDCPDDEHYHSRYQKYIELYVDPPPYPLRSSVERVLETRDEPSLSATQAILESQFIAHVAACGRSEDVEHSFTQSLYAGLGDTAAEYVQGTMVQFTKDMIAETRHPVIQRQSPLELTDFGRVVLCTGLSPRSGIALADFAETFTPKPEPRSGSSIRKRYNVVWEPIILAMWNRICQAPDIQELDARSHKIGQRSYPVTFDNFTLVAMAWVSGVPIEPVAFLTFRGTPAQRHQIQQWLNEEKPVPLSDFEEDIEQVAAFCNEYLASQWAWVFRGASTIANYLGVSEMATEIAEMGSRLEHGVKHPTTAKLLQQGCPIDRAKLDWLIGSFRVFPFLQSEDLEPDQLLDWIMRGEEQLAGRAFTPFVRMRINAEDIKELKKFLRAQTHRETRQ